MYGTTSAVDPIRPMAERLAIEWLQGQELCDCAIQVQQVAIRLLPALAMFEDEIRRGYSSQVADMERRMAIYCRRARRQLAEGLHKPGASAAIPADRREHRDVGPHC